MLTLDDLNTVAGIDERTVRIVNAYIKGKGVRIVGDVPDDIKQAGIELAEAFIAGELLAGRSEGVVVSQSSKAGDVSVSKTFANGSQAMSRGEMIALALLEPYINQSAIAIVPFGRI